MGGKCGLHERGETTHEHRHPTYEAITALYIGVPVEGHAHLIRTETIDCLHDHCLTGICRKPPH